MKNWEITGFLAILIFGFLLISGCTQDNSKYCSDNFPGTYYDPSSKMCEHATTPTPQIVYVTVLVTPNLTPTITSQVILPSKTPSARPTTMKPFPRSTYQIYETASNGIVKVTINNKRFVDKFPMIGPTGKQEYLLASRGQWMVLEVTVENIQSVSSSPGYFTLYDNREGTHISGPSPGTLDFRLLYRNLEPGQKVTGELAFQVTTNPIDLKIEYTNYGQSIFFNI
jgi:hypothetical protein